MYRIVKIEDVSFRMPDGKFTTNILEAENFNTFDDALKYIIPDTIIIYVRPKYKM
jgi:hypothetical protein